MCSTVLDIGKSSAHALYTAIFKISFLSLYVFLSPVYIGRVVDIDKPTSKIAVYRACALYTDIDKPSTRPINLFLSSSLSRPIFFFSVFLDIDKPSTRPIYGYFTCQCQAHTPYIRLFFFSLSCCLSVFLPFCRSLTRFLSLSLILSLSAQHWQVKHTPYQSLPLSLSVSTHFLFLCLSVVLSFFSLFPSSYLSQRSIDSSSAHALYAAIFKILESSWNIQYTTVVASQARAASKYIGLYSEYKASFPNV